MPVAFNAPPFPTADTAIAAAADSTGDKTSLPHDAFALMLLAAGGDPGTSAGQDATTAMTRGRLLDPRGGFITNMSLADPKGAATRLTPQDPLVPLARAKGDIEAEPVSASIIPISLDPAAMAAALSAAIAAGLKTDALPPPTAAAAETGELADRPRAILASASGRVGLDALPAATTTPGATLALRPSDLLGASASSKDLPAASVSPKDLLAASASSKDLLAASAASRDLLGESVTKAKDAPDLGAPSAFAHLISASDLAPAAAPTTVHTIDTPVTAPGWDSEFAGKLTQVVMLRNDRAEFHLHPAELGPIDVRITFASDQAVVLITAPHATTRDALEQALPYLRDMLADQGITLGQASVQGERNPADPGGASRREAVPPDSPAVQPMQEVAVRAIQLRGLVDVFA